MKYVAITLLTLMSICFGQYYIVVNEIMYNSPGFDKEWVELYNYSRSDAVLDSNWTISDGEGIFHFPTITIRGGGFLTIVVHLPDTGHLPFTPDVDATDHYIYLRNDSDQVIIKYRGTVIDSLTYHSSWGAPLTDGRGYTLERISAYRDSNDSTNWSPSRVLGGTPGAVNSCTGVFEEQTITDGRKLSIYPNPFNTGCEIRTYTGKSATVEIYDFSGKLVFSRRINTEKGNIYWIPKDIPPGVYIIKVRTDKDFQSSKAIYIR